MIKKVKGTIVGLSPKEFIKSKRAPCYLCKRFAGDKTAFVHSHRDVETRQLGHRLYSYSDNKSELHYNLCDECSLLLKNFSKMKALSSVSFKK
jgi:hypothetical protein